MQKFDSFRARPNNRAVLIAGGVMPALNRSHLAGIATAAFVAALAIAGAAPAQSPGDVHLLFTGDLMHHRAQERLGATHPDGALAGYFTMWQGIARAVEAADLAVGNLETPVAGGRNGEFPAFNAPVEFLAAARAVGFDMLTFANNHSLDRGLAGFAATFGNILANGMLPAGDGHPVTVVVKGRKISILAFTALVNAGSTWEVPKGRVGPYIVRWKSEPAREGLLEKIRAMRAASDLVVVSVHWGLEYRFVPSSRYRIWAQQMADAGADVIVGHHPHVVGPVEWLDRAGGGRTLVAYSLGNFSSGMIRDATPLGYILDVHLSRDDRLTAGLRMVWTARDNVRPPSPEGLRGPVVWRSYRTVMASDLEADCADPGLMPRTLAAPHECRRYREALDLIQKFQPGVMQEQAETPHNAPRP